MWLEPIPSEIEPARIPSLDHLSDEEGGVFSQRYGCLTDRQKLQPQLSNKDFLRLWSLEEAQVLRDTHVLPPPVLQAGLANLERGGSSRGGGKESGMVGRHRMSCNDIIQNHSMQNEYLHLKQEH